MVGLGCPRRGADPGRVGGARDQGLGPAPGARPHRPSTSQTGRPGRAGATRHGPAGARGVGVRRRHRPARHARGKAFRDVVRNLHGDVSTTSPTCRRGPATEQDVVDLLDWCARAGDRRDPLRRWQFGRRRGRAPLRGTRRSPSTCSTSTGCSSSIATSRAARIQAGVYGPPLEDQLRPHGLTLRHFPQSFEFSTLGGWLATRAGGHFATLYTHIDDLTESMRVVTPVGCERVTATPGSGAGPSPDRLFLGSEGTLASSPRRGCGCRTGPAGGSPPRSTFATSPRRWPRRGRSPSPGSTRRTAACSTPARRFSTPAPRPPVDFSCSASSRPTIPSARLARPRPGDRPRPRRQPSVATRDPTTSTPERRGGRLAVGVPADALPAGRAGPARHDRRDVRDRLHLGPLRGIPRRGHRGRPGRHRRRLRRRRGHLPVHPRLPRRAGAVLRHLRRRAGGAAPSRQWDEIKAAVSRSASSAPAAPSPTTTRSAATTARGTTASARSPSPPLSAAPSGRSTRRSPQPGRAPVRGRWRRARLTW